MTFLELAEKVLTEKKVPMKTGDIWSYGVEKGYDSLINSSGKTPWATLAAQLYSNVKDNPRCRFDVTQTRPKRFFMKSLDNIDKILIEVEKEESSKVIREERELKKKQYLEKELHPLLAYYAFHYLRCYTKTINHSKSSKKEFGEWVHPDMVGCDFEIEEWSEEVVELSSTIGNPSIKIYSFELKRKITLANLREVFFQAVSNSSWANESYLVAAEIVIDESLDTEIKRLSTSFGIGVIKLDTTNPDNSEIKYPALTKDNLDWDTVNKLTINPDFRMFLRRISNDLRSREVRKEWYDKILEKDKLESSFKTEF